MEDFIEKLIKGEKIEPPEEVVKAFMFNFPEAMNVDWYAEGKIYEAVFYLNSIEYIAEIDVKGNLLQYKMSLKDDNLPGLILNKVREKGELMNAVLFNSGNTIKYECIIRDINLKRWLVLYEDNGNILEEKLL